MAASEQTIGTKREPPKKAQKLRQLHLVIAAMQPIAHQPDHHTTEYAGLQRLDPERHSLTCRPQIAARQGIGELEQGADTGIHYQIGQQRRETCGPLVRAGQPHCNPHGKQYR